MLRQGGRRRPLRLWRPERQPDGEVVDVAIEPFWVKILRKPVSDRHKIAHPGVRRPSDQPRNIDDCLEKLKEMVLAVVARPTVRRPTKPSRASKRRRTEAKRENSQKKQHRRPPKADD